MTTAEVAALARVTPTTVARWAESGDLATALRLPGGQRRYRRSDVEALLTPASPQVAAAAPKGAA